jgi:Rne/Rng family ribonuclease
VRRTLLIAVSPGEAWAGLTEDDALVELRIARSGGAPRAGAFFLGRILGLNPALPAALVDIGAERPAFLGAEDAAPKKGLAGLHEGAAVVVQVTKEARADKAVGVTLRPRLTGAYLDWRPGRAGIAVRGGALDEAGRSRVAALLRAGEGCDIRAEATGASDSALAGDVAALRARWQAIESAAGAARPPARLEPEASPALELLGGFSEPPPDRIVIDDRAAFAEARGWLARHRPDLASHLAFHAGPSALFEAEGVAAEIEEALARRLALPGGGALTIEATAAAVMIDVDSGGAALMAANLAAAREAARQIRLRNLAGPIVIDFIAMRQAGDRERVRAALAAALAGLSPAPQLLGWTRLGHLELVRERRRAALEDVLYEGAADGGRVETVLTVALKALRALARAADASPGRGLRLRAAPEIAACLENGGACAARQALEARLGRPIALAPEPGRPRAAFDITPV